MEEVTDGSIVFNHVDFAYNKDSDESVLKDINLEIKSGETIGIIGGTGSAKTSLVNLISRLYDVTAGEIKVGGHDVREYDMEVLRNKVAVVLQNNVLFSGTIYDNLRWGIKMPLMTSVRKCADLPVLMNLSRNSRQVTIPILSREEAMYPVDKNKDFVLPEPFLRIQRY